MSLDKWPWSHHNLLKSRLRYIQTFTHKTSGMLRHRYLCMIGICIGLSDVFVWLMLEVQNTDELRAVLASNNCQAVWSDVRPRLDKDEGQFWSTLWDLTFPRQNINIAPMIFVLLDFYNWWMIINKWQVKRTADCRWVHAATSLSTIL